MLNQNTKKNNEVYTVGNKFKNSAQDEDNSELNVGKKNTSLKLFV